MDFTEHTDVGAEPIPIARCRELLGEQADALTDQEVESIPSTRGNDGLDPGRDVRERRPIVGVETCLANASCP